MKDLQKKTILELGSGRGGGLNYLFKYLNPEECVGVDLSANQVKFC